MTAPAQYSGELSARLPYLSGRGRDEAAANRPPSNALQLDHNELEVLTEAQRFAADEHRTFIGLLTEISRTAHELDEGTSVLRSKIQQALVTPAARNEAEVLLADQRSELARRAEQRMLAHTDLKYFRHLHSIKLEPSYPDSYIFYWGLLCILWVCEGVANAAFYENAQGLLGGFLVALGVSLVNIGTALGLGMLFRYRNLSEPSYQKYAGWLCAPVFAVITIYCNSLFAAFRGEYQALVDPSDPAALRSAFRAAAGQASGVFGGHLSIGDFMSFVLFAFGLLLSCIAFYKGMNYDDKYPGQGELHRRYRSARSDEEAYAEKIRQTLKTFLYGRRDELRGLTNQISQTIHRTAIVAAQLQQAWTEHKTRQEIIQHDCTRALQAYREANSSIRPTPPPSYFAQYPDVRREVEESAIVDVLNRLVGAKEAAQGLIDRYQHELTDKLNTVQLEAAEILDRLFTEFLADVDRQAAAAIDRTTGTVQAASRETAPNAQRA